MHVAAVLSKSPSRKGTAPRRQSFAARIPKGSAGGSIQASPPSTARGPGLAPAAVVPTLRGTAAVSGSTLAGPPSPLGRRQSLAGGGLTRMSGAAAGAKAGTQGLQQGLLGMAPISEEWSASQVGRHRMPAIPGLLQLPLQAFAAGPPSCTDPSCAPAALQASLHAAGRGVSWKC